ncbi:MULTISPECIES: hypothetical protein [unclassified Burkholderia]|uniref:hypothetical protein n=1 Tax=unclassified Burkholderia TaxID=2613784 RepID=UPI0014240299|nr:MULTISPECIES: hypothetical protein [unclassified Burkholderia]NIE84651.1 hypothetical protein [Burkholderia sp. Tr-860]NIF64784.1 hypothetical protein [Burkholderia sp. Cy-647]NIF71862.1 hypothetical protein [Burkholderia sp. Ap-962]NIF96793.1 hypothetical protein [Burkholderia sp. Ax-1720]
MKRTRWIWGTVACLTVVAVTVGLIRGTDASGEKSSVTTAQTNRSNGAQMTPTGSANSFTLSESRSGISNEEGGNGQPSESLRGEVTNKYHVRDDILEYIDGKYKDEKIRSAFINYAAAQQNLIEYGSTREAATQAADDINKRVTCIMQLIGTNRVDEIKIITAMSIDTEARFRAYWKAVDLQAGRVMYEPKGNPCE